jgi:hypothetical protein
MNESSAGAGGSIGSGSSPRKSSVAAGTGNLFLVRKGGELLMFSLAGGHEVPLDPDHALNLAAWIVAMVDPAQSRFKALLEEIESS